MFLIDTKSLSNRETFTSNIKPSDTFYFSVFFFSFFIRSKQGTIASKLNVTHQSCQFVRKTAVNFSTL